MQLQLSFKKQTNDGNLTQHKPLRDPTYKDVKKMSVQLRRVGKTERLLFHYNGHGVPKPTQNGEIWVFNKGFTEYIPMGLHELSSWLRKLRGLRIRLLGCESVVFERIDRTFSLFLGYAIDRHDTQTPTLEHRYSSSKIRMEASSSHTHTIQQRTNHTCDSHTHTQNTHNTHTHNTHTHRHHVFTATHNTHQNGTSMVHVS